MTATLITAVHLLFFVHKPLTLRVLCATLLNTPLAAIEEPFFFFLFTEFDCSVFGSSVLLYGRCFNIKLQYIVRLGPAVKMHGFVLQMHLFVYTVTELTLMH